VIVEAIRSDLFTGPQTLKFRKHSRYKCDFCEVTYEYIVHAHEGEWEALADPVPQHFNQLADRIDQGHATGHPDPVLQSDGRIVWRLPVDHLGSGQLT
jgi:hypothetical protein